MDRERIDIDLNDGRTRYTGPVSTKLELENPAPTTLLRTNSAGKFRAVEFNWSKTVENFGLLHVLWGLDIWYGHLPLCKTILLINIIIWLL